MSESDSGSDFDFDFVNAAATKTQLQIQAFAQVRRQPLETFNSSISIGHPTSPTQNARIAGRNGTQMGVVSSADQRSAKTSTAASEESCRVSSRSGKSSQKVKERLECGRGRRRRSDEVIVVEDYADRKERQEKTNEALTRLECVGLRSQVLNESVLDSSDISIVEETQVRNPKRLSLDELTAVKIRWKYEILRVTIGKGERLGLLFDKFGRLVDTNPDELEFTLDGKLLKRSDTCVSVNITLACFVEARLCTPTTPIEQNVPDGSIELKLQSSDTNIRKRIQSLRLFPDRKFEFLMKDYAEKNACDVKDLKFVFDGEPLNPYDTPEYLDLEGGECIDVYRVAVDNVATTRSKRQTRKK